MAAAIAEPARKTLAEVIQDLGNIPLDRIRLPVGAATDRDLIDALEAADKRLQAARKAHGALAV